MTLVALGVSRAMHEFLVLHKMATDSAQEQDVFLDNCLSAHGYVLALGGRCHYTCTITATLPLSQTIWIAGMTLLERSTALPQTWIEQITLDLSMAATGGEKARG